MRFWRYLLGREERLRREAADWLARMQGDDAARHETAYRIWRAADPDHGRAYDRLAALWSVSSHARGPAQLRPSGARITWRPALALGGALAAAALVGIAIGIDRSPVPTPDPAPVAIVAGRGPVETHRLSDGSRVTLDADSRIEVAYAPEVRRITLEKGRARFDVASDRRRPFVVRAGPAEVVARGTRFDVALAQGEAHVTLIEGEVDLFRRSGGRLQRVAIAMDPGEMMIMTPQDAPPPRPRPAPAAQLDWASGMLNFEDAPLSEVIAAANRYGPVSIRVDLAGAEEPRVTGIYKAGDNEGLARALARSFGLKLGRAKDGSLLLSR